MPRFPPGGLDNQQVADIAAYGVFIQHPPHLGGASLNYYGPVAEGLIAFGALGLLAGIARWTQSSAAQDGARCEPGSNAAARHRSASAISRQRSAAGPIHRACP